MSETCVCPNCGHLHPKMERPAPYGNCGLCGMAMPPTSVAAHQCYPTYPTIADGTRGMERGR